MGTQEDLRFTHQGSWHRDASAREHDCLNVAPTWPQPEAQAEGRVHRVRPDHLTEPSRSNEVWTVDFKGWFVLADGQRCDPLTVCDRYSRYIIGCYACANQQFKSTLRVFKKLMRHHGVPDIIRVDNGHPVCLQRPWRAVPAEHLVD